MRGFIVADIYNRLSITAKNLIIKYGRDITITQTDELGVEQPMTVKAVVDDVYDKFNNDDMVDRVTTGIMFSGLDLDFEPANNDRVLIGSDTWVIDGIAKEDHSGTVNIYYEASLYR